MTTLLVHCTHGREDPERATLAFVVGNVAASADQDVVVLLTIEGVWLATQGYAEDIHKEGFPASAGCDPVIPSAMAARSGPAAPAPRHVALPRDHLIEGAKIVTAANVVERLAGGAATLDF